MKIFNISEDFFSYIRNNFSADINSLRLRDHEREFEFDQPLALLQIEARRKTARKLSRFLEREDFLFPTLLASEQSTHQAVALYHTSLIGTSKRVADLTAGLGIDAFTLAQAGNAVTAFEMEEIRVKALKHNSSVLLSDLKDKTPDFQIIEGNSLEWLDKAGKSLCFDWIFIDPGRRKSDNSRTYFLRDCVPDVVSNFDLLCRHASKVMVKASPIMDISGVVKEIPSTKEIHLVCVKGECKEVLIIADCTSEGELDPRIVAVDLEDSDSLIETSRFETRFSKLSAEAPIADQSDISAGNFIYDPNAALHKLNCSSEICIRYSGLKRLAPNTDLYVSNTLHKSFPGRMFKIKEIAGKKTLAQMNGDKCEVISRNYPLNPEQIRAKYKLKSGDDEFIIAAKTTKQNLPTTFICERMVSR